MINSEGYAVIIDMGLAKFVTGKTYSMVGTRKIICLSMPLKLFFWKTINQFISRIYAFVVLPLFTASYIAAEVLLGKGHNQAVDYWALGCLLYEMIAGTTPFYWDGATQKDEFEAICRCDYQFGDDFSEGLKNLMGKLLVLDPSKRLGAGIRGHLDVMSHPWFDPINFKKLRKMEIASPWVPEVKDALDASNFAEYDESEITPPYRELSEKEQLLFTGF